MSIRARRRDLAAAQATVAARARLTDRSAETAVTADDLVSVDLDDGVPIKEAGEPNDADADQ